MRASKELIFYRIIVAFEYFFLFILQIRILNFHSKWDFIVLGRIFNFNMEWPVWKCTTNQLSYLILVSNNNHMYRESRERRENKSVQVIEKEKTMRNNSKVNDTIE